MINPYSLSVQSSNPTGTSFRSIDQRGNNYTPNPLSNAPRLLARVSEARGEEQQILNGARSCQPIRAAALTTTKCATTIAHGSVARRPCASALFLISYMLAGVQETRGQVTCLWVCMCWMASNTWQSGNGILLSEKPWNRTWTVVATCIDSSASPYLS